MQELEKPWWIIQAEEEGWTEILWDSSWGWRGECPGGNGGVRNIIQAPWHRIDKLEAQKIEDMAVKIMQGGINPVTAFLRAKKLLHIVYGGPDA